MPVHNSFITKSLIVSGSAFAVFLNPACVTTHVGNEYKFAEQKLIVSCGNDSRIHHDYVKSITCTIQNTGDTWVTTRFSEFRSLTTAEQSSYEILSPAKIKSFTAAYNFEESKERFNTQMILAGLIIGSAVIASAGDYNASSTLLSAGLAGAVSGEFIEEQEKAMGIQYEFGDQHLLGPAFELPPDSFVRKTILIGARNSKPGAWPDEIELCLAEPVAECRVLSFLSNRERVRVSE